MIDEMAMGLGNRMNQCYSFYLRMNQCNEAEAFPKLMCFEKTSDYFECKNNLKVSQYRAWAAVEFKKLQILSFPHYDISSNAFVDPKKPKSIDSFFNNEEKLKKFFAN